MDAVPADVVANVILATAAAVGAGVAGKLVVSEENGNHGAMSIGSSPEAAVGGGGAGGSAAAEGAGAKSEILGTPAAAAVAVAAPATPGTVKAEPQTGAAASIGKGIQNGYATTTDHRSSRPAMAATPSPAAPPPAAPAAPAAAPPPPAAATGSSQGPVFQTTAATTAPKLPGSSEAHEPRSPMLIVHAGTSTTYPVTLMELWNILLMAVSVWPKPYRLSWKQPQPMTAQSEFDPVKADSNNRQLAWKIWLVTKVLW